MPSETPRFNLDQNINDRMRSAEQDGVLRGAAFTLKGLMDYKVLTPIATRNDLLNIAGDSTVLAEAFTLVSNKLNNPIIDLGHVPSAEGFIIIDKPYTGPNGNEYHPLPKYLPLHVAQAHQEMDDAYKEYMGDQFLGVNKRPGLIVQSGYRSPYYQFAVYVKTMGFEGIDHTEVAMTPPGQSQHHDIDNTALDINSVGNWNGIKINPDGSAMGFEDTPEFAWILDNAPEHGFWLPYHPDPENPTAEVGKDGILVESWHIQYVGKEKAKNLTEQNNVRELFGKFKKRDRATA